MPLSVPTSSTTVEFVPGRLAMEFHRYAAVGAHQQHDAGVAQLLDLALERRLALRRQLEVQQFLGMGDGLADVGNGVGLQTPVPAIRVQFLGVVARVVVIPQTLDSGCPVQGTAPHATRGGAFVQQAHHVIRVLRRGGQTGVLEVVDADRQPAADFLRAVRMSHHLQAPLVRLVDHGFRFLVSHLVLVDQLDHVDAGIGQAVDLVAPVAGAVDAPAEGLGARIRPVLDEGTGYEQARARYCAARDAVAYRDRVLQRSAQVTGRGHPGQQQLHRGRRHDLGVETVGVLAVPVVVIGVPVDHQVDVHVPQAGQYRSAR
jgi:hypothetical protein